jgi:hypothetical protein
MYAFFAKCEFNNPLIMKLQRMSGLTGRSAAIDGGDERRLWAVSTKRRQHAKVQPKVSSKQQIQPVPMLSLAYAYKQPSAATH